MIKKTSSNQPCGRDSEYTGIIGAFLKSFSIYINYGVELLNFQKKIGIIAGKEVKDHIMWFNFMAFLWYFRASEVKINKIA